MYKRQVLGPDAVQRGSFNKEGYLRFDFSHGEALTPSQVQEIEQIANTAIRDDFEVVTREMPLAEAKKLGAMSLFGEKYGDEVRVVEMNGPWSRELCGGTHVGSTSQLGSLSLVSEQSVGSGNRRVEALVGLNSFNHLAAERTLVNQLTGMLKVQSSAELPERLAATLEKLKETERQLAGLRQQQLQAQAGQLAQDAQTVGSVRAVLHDAGEIASADALRTLALDLRARLGSDAAVAAVAGVANGRPLVVVAVNDAARDAGLAAGQLVRSAATALGGGGGGKPDVAQGGGSDPARIPDALNGIREQILATVG